MNSKLILVTWAVGAILVAAFITYGLSGLSMLNQAGDLTAAFFRLWLGFTLGMVSAVASCFVTIWLFKKGC